MRLISITFAIFVLLVYFVTRLTYQLGLIYSSSYGIKDAKPNNEAMPRQGIFATDSKTDTPVFASKLAKEEYDWNVKRVRIVSDLQLPSTVKEQLFTVIILTYKRLNKLIQSLNHYGHFRCVHRILVIWNDVNTEIPEKLTQDAYGAPVIFFKSKTNQLRNRFLPRKEIETQGKVTVDRVF